MNQVSWNVNNVPCATDYTYVPGSDLLAGMSTARTDGAYTPVTATYTYEDKRDVKTQVLNKAGARIISQYDYRYNAIGNRTSVVNSGEAFRSQYDVSSPENREGFNLYGYNSRSEVTESKRYSGTDVDHPPVDMVKPEYRSYAYDPIGNRTQAVEGNETQADCKTTTYTANGLNQYDTAHDETCTGTSGDTHFTYDADGNMTSVADSTGYTVYAFDCENRLVDVTIQTQASPVRKVTFAYDFMGRRIKKDVYSWNNGAWSPDSSRTFTWDGWLMTDETATASTPNSTSYVWGLDLSRTLTGAGGVGGLLSMTDEGGNNFNCYLYDANGNVTQLLDSNINNITVKYEYDVSGNCLYNDGFISMINLYRFSTKYFDNIDNLYYYGYRYYINKFGRWSERDFVDNLFNPYLFIKNNGINYIDLLGLEIIFENASGYLGYDAQDDVNIAANKLSISSIYHSRSTKKDIKHTFKTAKHDDIIVFLGHSVENRERTKALGLLMLRTIPFSELIIPNYYYTNEIIDDLNSSSENPAIIFLSACNSFSIGSEIFSKTKTKIVISINDEVPIIATYNIVRNILRGLERCKSIDDVINNNLNQTRVYSDNVTIYGSSYNRSQSIGNLLKKN